MNKCWKFQADILIHVWFRAKRLKICCNNRPPLGKHQQQLPRVGLLLQQIFSLSALNQTRIKVSSWNFQHLFIICLCKFDKNFKFSINNREKFEKFPPNTLSIMTQYHEPRPTPLGIMAKSCFSCFRPYWNDPTCFNSIYFSNKAIPIKTFGFEMMSRG